MSTKKPRSAQFKLKVALAALRGKQTIAEICSINKVNESLVHKWKKQLVDGGISVFSSSSSKSSLKSHEKELSKLYEKIGQLTIERDFLKKNLEK